MRFVFLDEAGYSPDWKRDIGNQPYYALSAVVIPSDRLEECYKGIRAVIDPLKVPGLAASIGKGAEVKASDVARGVGWWANHNVERNTVRETFLTAPIRYGGTAVLVVVDKAAHLKQYSSPDDPYLMSLQFIMERLEWYLGRARDVAFCVYDQNKRLEDQLHDGMSHLVSEGSPVTYYSAYYGQVVTYSYRIDRVLEMAFGNSKTSVGLQIADFFATMGYQYFRQGLPKDCGWWNSLASCLDREHGQANGTLRGYGLKLFPDAAFVGVAV